MSGVEATRAESPEEGDSREERIATRRKRVTVKIEADRRAALGEEPEKIEEEEVDPEKDRESHKQTEKSELRLEKLITDGTQLITNVAAAGDSKEVLRRQEDEESRKARYERLEAEVTAGAERFEEIMSKCSDSKDKRIPQDLQELLKNQKASCSAMIVEKDKLIHDFQDELKLKDDQYVKHLKKQAEDIDLILERMEEQAKTLLKSFGEEMEQIETSFSTERRKLLESQQAEWERTMDERRSKEQQFLEDCDKRIDDNEAQLRHLRIKNSEEFNKVKIKLETDIQILQQQIQQMKATFQLNAEKLEYNFQVLKKRDEENTVTISQQKRRITRLQDTLNNLRGKLARQEKACQSEMQALMEEYRKNTEQYRELQKKVKHFQMTDAKRFHDIWLMNEEKVRSLASDVLNADEIIHKQQLGLDWESPATVESPMTALTQVRARETSQATLYASQILSEAGSGGGGGGEEEVAGSDGDGPPTVEPTSRASTLPTVHNPKLIKDVLELLCEESEFLIESKLSRLLLPLESHERMLMKLDSIFKALGIETEDDIHQLVRYFISDDNDDVVEREEEGEGVTTGSRAQQPLEEIGHYALIHPNAVPQALCRFVEHRVGARKASTRTSKALALQPKHEELLDGSFWKEMTQVLPESHERVWSALLEGLDGYHGTLQRRAALKEETDGLRRQNGELRMLLHQYMNAKINRELEIPPTLTVPVANRSSH